MPPTRHEELVPTPPGGPSVTAVCEGGQLKVRVGLRAGADCVLHWGLGRRPGDAWQRPPDACWPEGTTPANGHAVRTPLALNDRGEREVTIRLDLPCPWRNLPFVLHFPREDRWLKDGGRDFCVPIPNGQGGRSPEEALAAWGLEGEARRQSITLDGGERLAVAAWETPEGVRVRMACDAGLPLLLHWGLAWRFPHEWQLPPEGFRPAGTTVFDRQAARTPFAERDGLSYLELQFPRPADGPGPRGLRFVLFQPDGASWIKSGDKDVYLPLFDCPADARLGSPGLWDLAGRIVAAEKGAGSWTLMHRFHLCHDLLAETQDDEDGMALLFAWMRYSATRQLDWQRRYNTKPRELSHAQDRLTARLAGVWRRHAPEAGAVVGCRTWARLLLTTLGRGGDGQRIRDEILHIMHRNHIKEMSGHFMEEWHQKLHNNTTPDDVVICEAYLAFLRGNGDAGTFYRVLEQGGVTRARLRSFERPIRSEPDFYADRKDALVGEFEGFLRVLKAVHAGTDLETAAAAARGRLDGGRARVVDGVLALRHRQAGARELAAAVTAAREGLRGAMAGAADDAALRDLLFLDLALDECLRGAVERQELSRLGRDDLAELVRWALRNLALSTGSQELAVCAGHWEALLGRPRDGRDWALHARSVADRAASWVQRFTDNLYRRLQPRAEFLGETFEVDRWAVPLFSEEVVRGSAAFALSLLLRRLDPVLRQAAGLGGWQVVSAAPASGRVCVTARLAEVQARRFPEATVLVADAVGGDEEIPEGVTAVITADTPDLLAHVSVRARNARVFLATCYDAEAYGRLKGLEGRHVRLRVTPGGDVEWAEGQEDALAPRPTPAPGAALRRPAGSSRWVVTQEQFTPEVVGGKSNNLNGLRGRLPDWIHLPRSLALPFGACERALEDAGNRDARRELEALAAAPDDLTPALPRLRALLLGLAPPAGLKDELLEAWRAAELPPVPWEQTWNAVRRVWASKWNERAYLSRRARGVAHDSLRMAVLIQQVVPAEYAYVIHTANPLTGDPDELYAEVVRGLGETLVGNYPGRALGFVCRKADLRPQVVSYPSKGTGLYGRGVIFRSDSNGEDLEGFAGAGLYDSVLAEEPEHRMLDYRGERLLWDPDFRDGLLRAVARVGLEVERALGPAQDVEGAVAGDRYHVVQARPQVGLAAG